jgi:hypothetical protein
MSAIRAVIQGHKMVGEHTEYRVDLCAGSAKLSSCSRRYREFEELHSQLSKFAGKIAFQVPDLPPKKFFGRTSESFVSKRKQELQVFLDKLVSGIVKNPPSETAWRLLCLFLALDPKQDVPEAILNLANHGQAGSHAAGAGAGAGAGAAPHGAAAGVRGAFDATGSAAMLAVPDAQGDAHHDLHNFESEEIRRMEGIVDEFARQTINVSRHSEEHLQVPTAAFLQQVDMAKLAAALECALLSKPLPQPLKAPAPQYAPIQGAEDMVVSLDKLSHGALASQASA